MNREALKLEEKRRAKLNHTAAQLALQVLRNPNSKVLIASSDAKSAEELFDRVKWWINWFNGTQ